MHTKKRKRWEVAIPRFNEHKLPKVIYHLTHAKVQKCDKEPMLVCGHGAWGSAPGPPSSCAVSFGEFGEFHRGWGAASRLRAR